MAMNRWAALTILFIGAMVACSFWTASSAWALDSTHIRTQWLVMEAILLSLCIGAGYLVNHRPDGVFINSDNRISLERAQWIAWLAVLLGGFYIESIWNVAVGWEDLQKGSFPDMQPELYALLGIVSGSVVVSNVIVDGKKNAPNAPPPPQNPQIGTPTQKGLIDQNVSPSEASWADLYLGEEVANRNVVDVSRLQKLIITILLVATYVQMIWTHLGADLVNAEGKVAKQAHFGHMPLVGQSFIWLLGISHAAYMAYKATPKTAS